MFCLINKQILHEYLKSEPSKDSEDPICWTKSWPIILVSAYSEENLGRAPTWVWLIDPRGAAAARATQKSNFNNTHKIRTEHWLQTWNDCFTLAKPQLDGAFLQTSLVSSWQGSAASSAPAHADSLNEDRKGLEVCPLTSLLRREIYLMHVISSTQKLQFWGRNSLSCSLFQRETLHFSYSFSHFSNQDFTTTPVLQCDVSQMCSRLMLSF